MQRLICLERNMDSLVQNHCIPPLPPYVRPTLAQAQAKRTHLQPTTEAHLESEAQLESEPQLELEPQLESEAMRGQGNRSNIYRVNMP